MHRLQVGEHAEFYFEEGSRAAADGRSADASSLFAKALKLEPTRFEIHAAYAKALSELGDVESAYSMAQRATQLDATDRSNQVLLAKLGIFMGRYRESAQRLVPLLESSGDDRCELLVLLAEAQRGDRDFEAAASSYFTAIETGDAPLEIVANLAQILAEELNRFDDAVRVLDDVAIQHSEDPRAFILRGQWYLDQSGENVRSMSANSGDRLERFLDQALNDAEQARKLSDDSPISLQFACMVLARQERYSEALLIAKTGIERAPHIIEFYRYAALAADAMALAANPVKRESTSVEGQRFLENGLAQHPNNPQLLWDLANRFVENDRVPDAKELLERLKRTTYPSALVRYLQAIIMFADGQNSAAADLLETVRSSVIEQAAEVRLVDLTLAKIYGAMGDIDRQIDVLRRVVALDSSWLPAREQLALALLKNGRIDEAVQAYQMIASQPNIALEAPLNFAKLLLIQNLARDESKRDWNKVEQLLGSISGDERATSQVAILRAEMEVAQGRVDDARATLRLAKSTPATWSARILLEISAKDWSAAEQLIEQAKKELGDTVELRYAAAVNVVSQNASDLTSVLSQLVVPAKDWTETEEIELAVQMIPLLITAGQFENAAILASKVANARPSDATSRLQLLEINYRAGKPDQMAETLIELERLAGRSAKWHYGMALQIAAETGRASKTADPEISVDMESFQLSEADSRRAQEHLAEAATLRPDWSSIPALSGALYDGVGNVESVILKYQNAVELGWRDPATIRKLIQLLTQQQRFSEADEVIRRLGTGSQPFTSEMARIASEVSVQLADLNRAVDLARQAAEQSKSAQDYLWLGQLHEMVNASEAAEQAYRKAIDAGPEQLQTQLAWIGFLERSSQLGEARKAVKRFESQLDSQDVKGLLAVAECHARIKDIAEARRVIDSIQWTKFESVDLFQRFYALVQMVDGSDSARDQLERWINPNVVVPESAERWSRRQLAIELASEGQPDKFQYARSLVQENLAADPESVADRTVQATVLAAFPGSSEPEKALEIFDQLLSEGWAPTALDKFVIGQLAILTGDWTRGRQQILSLLGDESTREAYHLRTYARLLLSRGDSREAELWIDKLRDTGDQNPETAELLAKLRFQRGQFDQLLRDLTAPPDVNAEDIDLEARWFVSTLGYAERYKTLASLSLEIDSEKFPEVQLQFDDAADEMVGQMKGKDQFPGAFYAIQLMLRGQCENALNALQKVIESATEDELVQFAEGALGGSACDTGVIRQIELVYQSLSNGKQESTVFAVIVARLREARGDFSGAIGVYQTLLKRDQANVVSLNNLAVLLALTQEDPQQAIELCNRAIELEGELMFLLDTRGVAKLLAGDQAGAEADLKNALAKSQHPAIHFHLAWAAFSNGDLTAAKRYMDAALASGLVASELHPLEQKTFATLSNIP